MKRFSLILLMALATVAQAEQPLHINAVKDMLAQGHKEVPEVTPIELKHMIDNDDPFILIDIREPDQVNRGEIFYTDLYKITRGYLEFKIEPIAPDSKTPIVVYCCTGKRSLLAAQSLKRMGYTNVRSLQGGIQKWVETGLPLFTPFGEMIVMPQSYDPESAYKEHEKYEKHVAEMKEEKTKTGK